MLLNDHIVFHICQFLIIWTSSLKLNLCRNQFFLRVQYPFSSNFFFISVYSFCASFSSFVNWVIFLVESLACSFEAFLSFSYNFWYSTFKLSSSDANLALFFSELATYSLHFSSLSLTFFSSSSIRLPQKNFFPMEYLMFVNQLVISEK